MTKSQIISKCPRCNARHIQELDSDQMEIAHRLGIVTEKILCEACSALVDAEEKKERDLQMAKKRFTYVIESLGIDSPSESGLKPEMLATSKLRPNPGIYLYGEPRGGKTCLAALIAKRQIWKSRKECEVLLGTDLKWLVNPAPQDEELARQTEAAWREAPLLIIDDLDKRRGTGAAVEYVYRILNHRLGRGMATIITANASLEQLSGKLSGQDVQRHDVSAIIARIQQYCQIIKI